MTMAITPSLCVHDAQYVVWQMAKWLRAASGRDDRTSEKQPHTAHGTVADCNYIDKYPSRK